MPIAYQSRPLLNSVHLQSKPSKAIDHKLGSTSEPSTNEMEETLDALLKIRDLYHEKALTNIKKSQEKQKARFDAKHGRFHVKGFVIVCSIA